MPLSRLSDERLYVDYGYYCDRFAAVPHPSMPATERLIYHCFWHGPLTWHHELSLKSLMVTQTGPFEVWLWVTLPTLQRNAAFLSAMDDPRLRVKVCPPVQLAQDTPLEAYVNRVEALGEWKLCKRNMWVSISDTLRTLVLLKHGGIYFDLDVLFLKDLRALAGVDFIYPWSNQTYGNSAVAHFRLGSTNLQALAARGAAIGTCHPRQLYVYEAIDPIVEDLRLWPVFAFDPAWIAHDTRVPINAYSRQLRDFFEVEEPVSLETFYPASYAYHWHNGWKCELTERSIAGQLYRQVCDLYTVLR